MREYHQKHSVTNTPRPLWAPWRIEYIREDKVDDSCFLCRAPQEHETENLVIARGNQCFVMLNAFPYNSGHVLISPFEHVADLEELDDNVHHELMDLIVKTKTVLRNVMWPDGFNVGFNLGSAAGAGVEEHIHGHIVPRWEGDTNFMPVLSNTRVVPEALEDTAKLLREKWETSQ